MRATATVDIKVFGELEVRVGRHDRTPTGRLPRAILSVLISRLGDAVSADALIEAAWNGSPPRTARSSLRVHISRIRDDVGLDDLLVTTEHGYRMQTDPQAIDVYRFELAAQEGRRLLRSGLYERAVATLRTALVEAQGEPYGDGQHLDALQPDIRRLVALKSEAEVDLAAAGLEAPGTDLDAATLEALVESNPLDERRWGILMTALYRRGRQADALEAFRRASSVLADELGLEPGPELRRLEERILLHDPDLEQTDGRTKVSLPGFATSMVGRTEEIRELAKLLGERRLLTVTGIGGVGKTRLATEAAAEAAPEYADGVTFVSLDSLADGGSVAETVLSNLGVPSTPRDPLEVLVDVVGERRMLLVLDNCEHVTAQVAALVNRISRSCERVGLLCTSRVPIATTGETIFPLSPLTIPPPEAEFTTPGELLRYESIALFCDRARQAVPGFTIDAQNGPLIARIVRRLGGFPLSIELAAARSDLLTPADLVDRIEAGLGVLGGGERDRAPRHRSMSDAISWTLDLLDEAACELFKRLAVFHSPVTAQAIEAVCSGGVLDTAAMQGALAALGRSSLVTVDLDQDRARYSQLPPIREVAHGLLGAEEQRIRDRHLEHFAQLAAAEAGVSGGPEESASFQRLTAVLDELRAALNHGVVRNREIGSRMCIDLGTYWLRSGRTQEGRQWVARFLDEARPFSNDTLASLLHIAGSLSLIEQDLGAADEALSGALELRRDLDGRRELAMTLSNLGGLANNRAEYQRAESLFREALEVFETDGHIREAAAAHLNLGLALLNRGDARTAIKEYEQAVDGFRRVGDRAEEGHALSRLGFAHAELGDLDRAEASRLAAHRISESLGRTPEIAYAHMNLAAHYLETADLELARQHAAASARLVVDEGLERWWVPNLVELAAGLAAAQGAPEEGARLFGCASAHRRAHGAVMPAAVREYNENKRRRIEDAVGSRRFLIETELGATRTLLEGVAEIADWMQGGVR